MESFIEVRLAGNLTRDPEFIEYPTGVLCGRLNVAINQSFKKRDGSIEKSVCFIDVTAWGEQALKCNGSAKKGDRVEIDGALRYEKWIDKADGKNRSKHSVTARNIVFPS